MRLSELNTGEKGVIVKVMGHGGFRKRIVEMGFVKGKRVEVVLNAPLAESYLRTLRDMAESYGLRDDISVMQLARIPDVLTVRQQPTDEDALTADVLSVVDMALEKFIAIILKL